MFGKLFGSKGKAAGGEPPQRVTDFSHVDSREKAEALARQGQLEKIHLFPLEFGGEDVLPNVTYVPPGLGQAKAMADGTVLKLIQDGQATQYAATPEYKGNSFVPARIAIKAWKPEAEGQFQATIEIW
jgi:hypothetical protein